MLSTSLEKTLRKALSIATSNRHEYATYEHLLLALVEDKNALQIFNHYKVDTIDLSKNLSRHIKIELKNLISDFTGEAKPTAGFQRIIQRATAHSQNNNDEHFQIKEISDFNLYQMQNSGNSNKNKSLQDGAKKNRLINGADLLPEFFFEHETYALQSLKNLGLNRNDIINTIEEIIDTSPEDSSNLEKNRALKQNISKNNSKHNDRLSNKNELNDIDKSTYYSKSADDYILDPFMMSDQEEDIIKSSKISKTDKSISHKKKKNLDNNNTITKRKAQEPSYSLSKLFDNNVDEDIDEKEAIEELEKYCTNLNEKAKHNDIDCLIGRHNEVQRTIEILCRRKKNNAILVGEPGVGKTAIAEGLAYRIHNKNVPEILEDTIIYALDLGALVAGTKYRGDFEERIRSMLDALKTLKQAVLFIDEIHSIIGAGSTANGSLDASNLLKPALARGELRCIGSTTFKEFHNHFEKDMALVRRFQKIIVEEPSEETTLGILNGLRPYYEKHHEVKYDESALKAAIHLSQRYINDRHLPDKAIDLIDEAGARCKISHNEKQRHNTKEPLSSLSSEIDNSNKTKINNINISNHKKQKIVPIVTERDIENVITSMLNIPKINLANDEIKQLKTLEENLKKAIFGQDEAIKELCNSIKLSRAGLRKGTKPTGCYLFSGKTGVGKTELAKQLALNCNMKLIKFDMSEFSESNSVAKLIGSAPGYVGFEQGGLLTEEVDKYPYSVVLLDEIEKANQDIYNLLLQIMDEGCLTDNTGKTVDFTSSMIILTTNIQPKKQSVKIGFSTDIKDTHDSKPSRELTADQNDTDDNFDMTNFEEVFSAEFRSRLDKIIIFNEIDGIIGKIIDKNFKELTEQLAEKNIAISISKSVKKYIIEKRFNHNTGARGIDKVIDSEIKQYIVDDILFGSLSKGGFIHVDFDKNSGKIKFNFTQKISKEIAET